MAQTLVIIPTYNEKDNIAKLIADILAQNLDLDILVVDDNSPDGTAGVVESLKLKSHKVNLLQRVNERGFASAYLAGFKWALEHDYQFIIQMDGDLSHQPKYLADFLQVIENADLVLGSRYIQGGGVKNWGIIRQLISRFGSWYARTILNLKIKDLTGGYKCWQAEALQTIDFSQVKADGYLFQIEMTYKIIKQGFKVKEIPIIFINRTQGKSKFNKQIVLEAIFGVWRLRHKS